MLLIDGTGDYVNDVGTRVKDSETNWHEEQDDLPAISVFDGEATVPDPEAVDKLSHAILVQRFLFRGYVKQGTDASAARSLIADIYTAIRTDTQWNEANTPLVMQTRMVRHAVNRTPDNFEIEGCEVEVEMQYFVQKFTA